MYLLFEPMYVTPYKCASRSAFGFTHTGWDVQLFTRLHLVKRWMRGALPPRPYTLLCYGVQAQGNLIFCLFVWKLKNDLQDLSTVTHQLRSPKCGWPAVKFLLLCGVSTRRISTSGPVSCFKTKPCRSSLLLPALSNIKTALSVLSKARMHTAGKFHVKL